LEHKNAILTDIFAFHGSHGNSEIVLCNVFILIYYTIFSLMRKNKYCMTLVIKLYIMFLILLYLKILYPP